VITATQRQTHKPGWLPVCWCQEEVLLPSSSKVLFPLGCCDHSYTKTNPQQAWLAGGLFCLCQEEVLPSCKVLFPLGCCDHNYTETKAQKPGGLFVCARRYLRCSAASLFLLSVPVRSNRSTQAQFCCCCCCCRRCSASEDQHKDYYYYYLPCGTLLLVCLCGRIPDRVQEEWVREREREREREILSQQVAARLHNT